MNFSCSQETLSKYLSLISRIVNTKNSMPILSNVLLKVEKGKLIMTATDLELGLHTWVGSEVRESGEITVPAKQLAEYVSSLPSGKVDFVLKNNVLTVSSTNNTADFNTISPEDFPQVATSVNDKPTVTIPIVDFLKVVERVAFSAATDNIKPVLTGILVEIRDDLISFVSADSLRLSRQVVRMKTGVAEDIDLLIPSRAFVEMASIINATNSESKSETLELYVLEDNNQVLLKFGDIDLVSRMLDGQFPAYKQIIPTGYKIKAEFEKEAFSKSLKITNIIARNVVGNKIVLNIDEDKKTITLSASMSDVGSNESSFEAKIEGGALQIAFNGKFLNDLISHVDGDTLVFEAVSAVNAGVFRIKDDNDFIHLIMPMML